MGTDKKKWKNQKNVGENKKNRNKSRSRKQMWNKVISQIRGDNENWMFKNQCNLR